MPTPPRMRLQPGEELAGYRIESYIARGGMAVVYLARDISLGRPVALKLLAPELASHEGFRSRFIRESELAASVDHPNILPVYGAGEAGDVLYIAMRYVDGQDLARLLDGRAAAGPGRGRLTVAEALPLFTQVAGALDAAHGVGLVHRDVKPGNILVSDATRALDQCHVYLADFGLTKRSTSMSGLTATGQFLGTLAYVAPEQIAGRQLDERTDIYSLGCVMFQALAGEVPFPRDDDAAVLWAHMSEARPALSDHRDDLPPDVDAVLTRAMARDPDERQPSCQAVIEELRRALRPAQPPPAAAGGAPARAVPRTPTPAASHPPNRDAPSEPSSRRPWWRTPPALIGAVAAVVAIAVALPFVLSGGKGEKTTSVDSSTAARDLTRRVTLTPADWGTQYVRRDPYEIDDLTDSSDDENCTNFTQPVVDALAALRRDVRTSDDAVWAYSKLIVYRSADTTRYYVARLRDDARRCQTEYDAESKAQWDHIHEATIPALKGFDEVVAEEGRLVVNTEGQKRNNYYTLLYGRKGQFLLQSYVNRYGSKTQGQSRIDAINALSLMLSRL